MTALEAALPGRDAVHAYEAAFTERQALYVRWKHATSMRRAWLKAAADARRPKRKRKRDYKAERLIRAERKAQRHEHLAMEQVAAEVDCSSPEDEGESSCASDDDGFTVHHFMAFVAPASAQLQLRGE